MPISKHFTTTFDLYKWSTTKVDFEVQEGFTLEGSYKGAFDASRVERSFEFDQQRFVASHQLWCSADVPAAERDQIEVGGIRYEILAAINPFHKNHHKQLELRQLR